MPEFFWSDARHTPAHVRGLAMSCDAAPSPAAFDAEFGVLLDALADAGEDALVRHLLWRHNPLESHAEGGEPLEPLLDGHFAAHRLDEAIGRYGQADDLGYAIRGEWRGLGLLPTVDSWDRGILYANTLAGILKDRGLAGYAVRLRATEGGVQVLVPRRLSGLSNQGTWWLGYPDHLMLCRARDWIDRLVTALFPGRQYVFDIRW